MGGVAWLGVSLAVVAMLGICHGYLPGESRVWPECSRSQAALEPLVLPDVDLPVVAVVRRGRRAGGLGACGAAAGGSGVRIMALSSPEAGSSPASVRPFCAASAAALAAAARLSPTVPLPAAVCALALARSASTSSWYLAICASEIRPRAEILTPASMSR